jgi:anti-sigma factor RsiW
MSNCESVREVLGAWLDGELNTMDARSVQLHVDQCAACSGERRQLERLQSLLTGVVPAGASEIAFEPFWQRVQQRIAESETSRARQVGWLESMVSPLRLAWAVPAVIAVILGVLSLESVVVPTWREETQRNNLASVESIDAYGLNVTLFRDNDTNTTVIWLYRNQEGEDESSGEPAETSHSF